MSGISQSLRSVLSIGRAAATTPLRPAGRGQPNDRSPISARPPSGPALPLGSVSAAAVAIAAGGVALARLLRRVEVHGASMMPGLRPGDRLLVRATRRVAAGDVVVVSDPEQPCRLVVKRVSAVDGDLVTVLGDNAAASRDSRHFGPLPRSAVVGKVWWRYYPPGRAGPPGVPPLPLDGSDV